jgi:hypothetical protein
MNADPININRMDALGFVQKARQMDAKGVATIRDDGMHDVMQHNYLRKSIEQRVENKVLIRDYKLK